jgi:hypothetical protein
MPGSPQWSLSRRSAIGNKINKKKTIVDKVTLDKKFGTFVDVKCVPACGIGPSKETRNSSK